MAVSDVSNCSMPMYKYQIFSEIHLLHPLVKWTIKDFTKLRNEVNYTYSCKTYDWAFSLVKKKDSLRVTVDLKESNQNVECCICNDGKIDKKFIKAVECGKGKYEVKFRQEDFRGQKFVADIKRIFLFKVSPLPSRRISLTTSKLAEDDAEFMYKDLKPFSLPKRRVNDDFLLLTKCTGFPVHKSILAIRSKLFSDYFNKDPHSNVKIVDVPDDVLNQILTFVYTGKVQLNGEWDNTKAVFKHSIALGVKRLVCVLAFHLQKIMNYDNVNNIKELGQETNVKELVIAADDMLNQR